MKPIHYLLIVFASVKIFIMSTRYHLLDWDEAVYVAMGRYIYSGGELGIFEALRPLGLPLLLPGGVFLGDMLILLFSLGTIYLTYIIGRTIFNERVGFIAAILIAITPLFFYFSSKIYTGIPTSLFMLLAIYMYLRKRFVLAGVFAGISFLFRFPAGIILVVLLLALSLEKQRLKSAVQVLVAFAVIVLPYFVFSWIAYGDPFHTLALAVEHQHNLFFRIDGLSRNLFYYPSILFMPNIILALSVVGFYWYSKKLNIIYLAFVLNLAYFTYITNKQPRFGLIMLPYAAILTSYVLWKMLKRLKILYRYGVLSILVIVLLIATYHNILNIKSMPDEKPDIVSEIWEYEFEGIVMTTDPGLAVYSEARTIPSYGSVEYVLNDMNNIEHDFFVHFPAVLPCWDEQCEQNKRKLEHKLETEYELIYDFQNVRGVYRKII